MKLVVVESPTKARTLSRFLGEGFVVKATMGHIKDLPHSKLGVDVDNNFEPEYTVIDKRRKDIEKIQKAAKKAENIYLATDPDREGEAIAKHVYDEIDSDSKVKRIVFHEITRSAVEQAIASPRQLDLNLVDAQIARRVLDRLVGYKLSPLLWKKIRRGLSAGRVQSVAVRLIVEREEEIKAFKPEEYWEIFCQLKSQEEKAQNKPFSAKLVEVNSKKADIKEEGQAKEIKKALEQSSFKVLDIKRHEVKKNLPAPFTTSTMTQAAARLFSWSAKRTMSVAQRLYEEGLITYHRTDSTNIAKSAIERARDFIKENYGAGYLPEKPRFYKTKAKVAQEAHEAIRPTDVFKNDVKISNQAKDAEKLYSLIWKRFVACQMREAVYDRTTIYIQALANKGRNEYLLKVSGEVVKFDGWKRLWSEKEETIQLPSLSTEETLQLIKVDALRKFTQPPARFNEASLIKTLEKLGIGRPSTYAPIISTIQTRNYVEKKEGKFYPTPIGVAVNHFLVKNFPEIFDYSFTAKMENDLDRVAAGKSKWRETISRFWNPFFKKLETVEEKSKRVRIKTESLGKKCPKCKKGKLVIRIGRFGKFISCSLFPECDYTQKYIEKVGTKCPDCLEGEVIIKQSKKGRKFYGCSRYPKCKWASWRKPKVEKV